MKHRYVTRDDLQEAFVFVVSRNLNLLGTFREFFTQMRLPRYVFHLRFIEAIRDYSKYYRYPDLLIYDWDEAEFSDLSLLVSYKDSPIKQVPLLVLQSHGTLTTEIFPLRSLSSLQFLDLPLSYLPLKKAMRETLAQINRDEIKEI